MPCSETSVLSMEENSSYIASFMFDKATLWQHICRRIYIYHRYCIICTCDLWNGVTVIWMNWYNYNFLSGFKCTFSCIVQYFLYHDMDIGTMWHCTLASSTPSPSIGLFFGCAFFRCWVSLGAPVIISLIEFYFIMIFIMILVTIIGNFMAINYFLNYTLGFLYRNSSGSANAQLPGCVHPWTFSLNIRLNVYLWSHLCHVYIPY